MRVKTLELVVGAFVLLGICAIVLLALRVSGLAPQGTESSYRLYASFENVGSLSSRAKVAMSGVEIGRVVNISLDPNTYMARVEMEMNGPANTLPTDSAAAIVTSGLLGGKFISITVGGSDEFLQDGDTIYDTQSALLLEDLIGKFLLNSTGSP